MCCQCVIAGTQSVGANHGACRCADEQFMFIVLLVAGCGKTALVNIVAARHRVRSCCMIIKAIVMLHCCRVVSVTQTFLTLASERATSSDAGFQQLIARARQLRPAILLFDNIDTVFPPDQHGDNDHFLLLSRFVAALKALEAETASAHSPTQVSLTTTDANTSATTTATTTSTQTLRDEKDSKSTSTSTNDDVGIEVSLPLSLSLSLGPQVLVVGVTNNVNRLSVIARKNFAMEIGIDIPSSAQRAAISHITLLHCD